MRLIVEELTDGDFTEGSVIPEKRRLRFDISRTFGGVREIYKPVDPKKGTPAVCISTKDRGKYSSQTGSLHSVRAVAVSEGALVLGEMTFVVESVRVFLVQYLVLYDAFDAPETFWA